MKPSFQVCALVFMCGFASPAASATVRYVNLNSATPSAPYTNWSTAATVIQDAIDVAEPGDEIVVTNGIYQIGGREVSRPASGTFLHRVAVTQPVIVRSVNGAELTIIDAAKEMRCVYLSDGATLVGFTLSNGVTGRPYNSFQSGGGGAWCEAASSISNCIFSGNIASFEGGGVYGGNLDKCIFKGNSACNGGASAYANLNDCLVSGNTADFVGGGTYFGLGNNCTLVGNSAQNLGGGCYGTALNGSVVTSNRAATGGGAFGGTMNNCTITANSASDQAGGVSAGEDSFVAAGLCNEAGCAAYGGVFNNCIVYYNDAPVAPNFSSEAILNYSCTVPMPLNGTANITIEPQLASSFHISAVSPCRGAGSSTYVSGVDIDGESWANPPSIGCDEKLPGQETGPISAAIEATFTNFATGFEVHFTAGISGNVSASHWEFGDGTIMSNRPYTSHAWTVPGDYAVVLRTVNQSFPMGVTATVTVHVAAQAVRHVGGEEASNPVPPYISWATAAREIQEAIDVALPGDEVLVTNGVYRTGGRTVHGLLTNRVAITRPINVRSVNGPAVTLVEGYRMPLTDFGPSAVRCVYLTNGAALIGFTLTNGGNYVGGGVWCESVGATLSHCILTDNAALSDGGGVYRGTLLNCTLARNVADNGGGAYMARLTNCVVSTNSAFYGGGAIGGTLTACTLTGNSGGDGGGAWQSTLNNCLLVGNSAQSGGGAANSLLNNCVLTSNRATGSYLGGGGGTYGGTLNNCILYYNTALSPNYSDFTVLNYSCTTPLPPSGMGNITNAPLFMDPTAGDFRLQSYSPCINAGLNAYAAAGPDLDGKPRIVAGTVDIGAYEFQSPQSMISYAWLEQHGLLYGWPDFIDWDADGQDTWQEWQAGTDPTNSSSFLRMLSPVTEANGVVVSWESVSDRTYFLERSTNLSAQVPFTPLATDIMGETGTTAYTDTDAINVGPRFYRVGMNVDSRSWPGEWDRSFSPDTSLDLGPVFALQPDGNIIVASSQRWIGSWFPGPGFPFQGIRVLRLNPDGSIDKTFLAVTVNDSVSEIALDQAGRVLVGGEFSMVNGQLRDGMARLNPDGTVDTTFMPLEDIKGVAAFVVQPDGRIVIRNSAGRLLRLNTDGSLDNGFVPVISTGSFDGPMASAADGKVLLSSGWTTETDACLLWRLEANGQIDPTFHRPAFGASTPGIYLTGAAVQPDGRIVVGGWFSSVDGQPRSGIVRLSADGTVDLTFTPSAGRPYQGSALALDASGRVLIATYGDFSLLKPNGEEDPDFYFMSRAVDPLAYGLSADWFSTVIQVSRVAIQPDGGFLLGGFAEFYVCAPPLRCAIEDMTLLPFLGRLHGKSTAPR